MKYNLDRLIEGYRAVTNNHIKDFKMNKPFDRRDFIKGGIVTSLALAIGGASCTKKKEEKKEDPILDPVIPVTDELEGLAAMVDVITTDPYKLDVIYNMDGEEIHVAYTDNNGDRKETDFAPDGWVSYGNYTYCWPFEFNSSTNGVTSYQKSVIQGFNSKAGTSVNKIILIDANIPKTQIKEETDAYLSKYKSEINGTLAGRLTSTRDVSRDVSLAAGALALAQFGREFYHKIKEEIKGTMYEPPKNLRMG